MLGKLWVFPASIDDGQRIVNAGRAEHPIELMLQPRTIVSLLSPQLLVDRSPIFFQGRER